jgi:hypothetical protein
MLPAAGVNLIALSTRFRISRSSQFGSPWTTTVAANRLGLQRDPFCLRYWLELVDERAGELAKVDRFTAQPDLARLRPRERQHLIDQPFQLVDLFELARETAPDVLGIGSPCHRHLDVAPQRGQRRAELVGERGAELPHFTDRMFESGQRVVERRRHHVELVARAADGQPRAEVPDVDGSGHVGEIDQRPEGDAGQPSADHEGDDQTGRHAHDEQDEESIQRRVHRRKQDADLQQVRVAGRRVRTLLDTRILP